VESIFAPIQTDDLDSNDAPSPNTVRRIVNTRIVVDRQVLTRRD